MESKEDEKKRRKDSRGKDKIVKKNYLCFWSKLLRQVSAAQCLELFV